MAEGEREGGHPSSPELDRFLLGEMTPRQAAPIVAHLVRGCAFCRQRMAPLAAVVFANGPLAPPSSPELKPEYDFPLFKALASARQYAESRARGEVDSRRRLRKVLPKVPALAVSSPSARDREPWNRCERLLSHCRSLRFSDPEGMVLAASLAVTLAEKLEASQGRSEELVDLQARAWAELGNAHRVADDLPAAETALTRALDLLGRGTGDPLLLAQMMDLTASLYTDQRRFREAQHLLDWVSEIYWRAGDKHLAARALVSKGISVGLASRSEEAVDLLMRGFLLLDSARDPKLTLSAVHGLLWFLVDCGKVSEVNSLLHQVRDLYTIFGEHLLQLRVRWLEGRVAAGLDENQRAEQSFLQVRAGFLEAEQPYDSALVSLDLAAVWLRQGRTSDIVELVDEMVAVFRARNIQREAIAALLMLREALQKDQATSALLQTVSAGLRRLERSPVQKR